MDNKILNIKIEIGLQSLESKYYLNIMKLDYYY